MYFPFQGITVPREDWYWPKADADDEEDSPEEEEEEEEIVELTVSTNFACLFSKTMFSPVI